MMRLKMDQIMEERSISAYKLAKMTGIRWNTVDDMMKNKARHWSPDNLERIMEVLEIEKIEDLIEYKKGRPEA